MNRPFNIHTHLFFTSPRLRSRFVNCHHSNKFTNDVFVDVSPIASDLQRLSMRESKLEVPSSGDNSTVLLPNHLQALAAECSHLSFGTYNGGNNSASSASLASNNLSKSGLEEKSAAVDDSLAQFPDARHFLFRFPTSDILSFVYCSSFSCFFLY